jgi:tetratricopeptide (TPR) repeat protein
MRQVAFVAVAILMVAGISACASSRGGEPAAGDGRAGPPVADEERLPEAERAYKLGDPVRVVHLLGGIEPDDPRYERASELLARAREDVEVIVVDWLETLDRLIYDRSFRAARARGRFLLQNFPLSDERRTLIESRLERIDAGVDAARQEIEDLRAVAADQLMRHDYDGALRTLREAAALARRFNFGEALEIERVIAATELRAEELAPDVVASARGGRRPSKTKRRPTTSGDKPETNGNGHATPAPAPAISAANAKKLQQLLKDAARHQRRRRYYDAIVTYERVLSDFDATNETAKTALQSLAPRREALIREYLAKANRQFVKQDLAGAAPYFRKVLVLDPSNQEAKEGLQMYDNLQRIRGQRDRIR